MTALRSYAEALGKKHAASQLRTMPGNAVVGINRFLTSVQTDGGARYGYTGPGDSEATTAVGLTSRLYLGESLQNPAMQRGIEFLDAKGPSPDNLYYTYYATQVMWHTGGQKWKRWNDRIRDPLTKSQCHDGVNSGSWYSSKEKYAEKGGRLLHTVLATLILESYYRHRPLHQGGVPAGPARTKRQPK